MPCTHSLKQLDNFVNLIVLRKRLKTERVTNLFDSVLFLVGFSDRVHTREQISNQAFEQRNIIINKLRHVHVSKCSHKGVFFRKSLVLSFELTSHHQH
jgi:hypothetical protein